MAKPLQKGWLPSHGSLRQQKGTSSDPKAVSGNSANKTYPTSFGVMPVLMKFTQFLDLAWLISCCLSAQSEFGPLCKVQVVTTQLYWDVQEIGHCCTGCSKAPEMGFALTDLHWSYPSSQPSVERKAVILKVNLLSLLLSTEWTEHLGWLALMWISSFWWNVYSCSLLTTQPAEWQECWFRRAFNHVPVLERKRLEKKKRGGGERKV